MENGQIRKTKSMKKLLNKPINWLFKENPFYLAAFFLPAGILLTSYIIFGIFPVGQRSVLALDMNAQYVYYFDYMHDVFRGQESLFYSWSRNLSGEFFGIIGYYLASPFNFLVWIFPREYITEGLLTMILVKVGAIGVTTAVYLKRGRGLSTGTTIIFSMMYALCSYTIVQTMNPMWLDGVMALPLIIYGVESLVRHGRFRLLTVWLAYSFITCFYIGYMLGIFTALYFVCYLISSRSTEKLDRSGVMARVGIFSVSTAAAVLMSSFMLIPVYSSLQLGKLEFTSPFEDSSFLTKSNFNLLDLGGKLLPNSYDTVRWDGLPFLYCGVLAVILAPLFFLAGKEKIVSMKKRLTGAILLLTLVLFMYITPIDTLMHGGQVPNWLPYRYSFIISFLLMAWGAEVFEKISAYSRRAIGFSALAFFGLFILLESRDTFAPQLGDNGRELLDGVTVIVPAILFLAVFAILLILKDHKLLRNKKRVFCLVIGVIVFSELLYSTYASIIKQNVDITYSTRESYVDFVIPLRKKVAEIRTEDDGFYRMEKNFFRAVNDPMALNMYGLSHSSSMLNDKVIALLGQLGMTSKGHYTRYSGATPIIDDLFGVKYIFSHEVYELGGKISEGNLEVENNQDAMPLAYLTDPALKFLSFADDPNDYSTNEINVFNHQNSLVSAMLGEDRIVDYIRLIESRYIQKETENLIEGTGPGGHYSYTVTNSGADAKVRYNIMAQADGEIFMWLPSDYERRLNVWVNRNVGNREVNEWKGNYFEFDDYCIKSLGEFSRGERFSVTLTLTKGDLFYKDAFFAYIDRSVYLPALERLHAMNADTVVTKTSPTSLRIETSSDVERLLFTTIPAEPGWTVTVNGVRTRYFEVLDSLIAVTLPAGNNVVEMKFTPSGYPIAMFMTIAGLIVFTLFCLLHLKLKKEREALGQTGDGADETGFDDNKNINVKYNTEEPQYKQTEETEELRRAETQTHLPETEPIIEDYEELKDEYEDESEEWDFDDAEADDEVFGIMSDDESHESDQPEELEETEESEETEDWDFGGAGADEDAFGIMSDDESYEQDESEEFEGLEEFDEFDEFDEFEEPDESDEPDEFDELILGREESLQSIIEDFQAINEELDPEETKTSEIQQAQLAEQQAEQQRQAQLAEQWAEQQRQAQLAEQWAEQQRQAQLAEQQAEQQRQAQWAEQQRQAQLAEQQAEQQRQVQLAQQQAEQQRQVQLAQQQAEQQRQAQLAEQQAEQQRQQAYLQQQAYQRQQAQQRFYEQAFGERPPQPEQPVREWYEEPVSTPEHIQGYHSHDPDNLSQRHTVTNDDYNREEHNEHDPASEKQADFLKIFDEIAKMNQPGHNSGIEG
ncbi:MAG: YfhO family protein [Oscillospiraceae bacterium]|nr:YfhO family protein [Oscillospiraceae bacterium]